MQGREVGPYTLVERLGGGGMGEVWRARHAMLGRSAAVKLIAPNPSVDRELLLDRLVREARATSMLQSLNTVQVYDFGVTEDGAFWASMELLDGMDLRDLVEQHGPVPPARARAILLQICESLAEAHALGLVHRDIKPANVMVCRHGLKVDVAKVLDFGLVKAASDPELLPGPRLTASHAMLGSPAFMAPEALTSDAQVDSRVDQYGLGCVAIWLLTGELVFDHDHAMDMMLAHRAEAPTPPSERGVSGVPVAFDAVVLRCLAKEPDERFADMAELAEALRAIPVAAPWTEALARAWWSRHHEPRWQRTTPLPAPAMTWSEARAELAPSTPGTAPQGGEGEGGDGLAVVGAISAQRANTRETLELSSPTLATPTEIDARTLDSERKGPSRGPWILVGAAVVALVGSALWAAWPAGEPQKEVAAPPEEAARTDVDVEAEEAAASPQAPTPDATGVEPTVDLEVEPSPTRGNTAATPTPGTPEPEPTRTAPEPPAASQTPAEPAAGTAEPTAAPEPEPPPEPATCSLSGEFTAVTLRDAGGTVHRCAGALPPGRYEVFGDFAGEGPESGGLQLDVEPGSSLTLSCNRVDWSCTAR